MASWDDLPRAARRSRASTVRSPAPTWSSTRARPATSTRSTTTKSSPGPAGYPSVFSVGMLQAGILAGYATDWLGAEQRAPLRGAVPRAGVAGRHGRVLGHGHASVRGRRRAQGRRRAALHPVESGGAAIKGEATFVVP